MGSYANVCLWRFSQGSTDSSCLSPGFLIGRTDPWDWYIYIYIYVLVLISIRNTVWNTSHSSYGFGRKSEKSLSTVGTVVYGVYCLFEKISTFCFGFGFFVWGPEILPFGFKTSGWSLQQGKLVNQHQKGWNDGISPGWRGNPARYPDLQISLLLAKIVKFLAGSFEI